MDRREVKIIIDNGRKYFEKRLSSRVAYPKESDILSELVAYKYITNIKELEQYIPKFYGCENNFIRLEYFDYETLRDFMGFSKNLGDKDSHKDIVVNGITIKYASDKYDMVLFEIIEKLIMISDIFIKYKIQLWDLRPDNILINYNTSILQLVIIDFDSVGLNEQNAEYDYENILMLIQRLFSHYLVGIFLGDPYWTCGITDKEWMTSHLNTLRNTIIQTCPSTHTGLTLFDLINKFY
jgi:serine/threonine protein kinase